MSFNETNRVRPDRARRSRLLLCGLLAALVTSVGITWPTSHTDHPVVIRTVNAVAVNPYDHSVYMAGDSITWGTEPYLQFLFDIWNRNLVTDAFPGVTLQQVGLTWFQNRRNTMAIPPTAVVALGGNDSDQTVTSGMFPWLIWQAIETLTQPNPDGAPAVKHIYWINFYSQNPTYPGNNQVNDVTKNAILNWAVSFFPQTVTVLDWASYIRQHPEWILWDGVHYTPDGYAARALWIAEHIPV